MKNKDNHGSIRENPRSKIRENQRSNKKTH